MTEFDLQSIIDACPDMEQRYRDTLNHQAVRYWDAVGHKNVRFVGTEPHHLIDQNGNKYLDFVAGFATCHWGRNHPIIRSAITQAADCSYPNLLQIGVPTLPTVLADKLIAFTGGDFQRVFFTNSGAEATDYAIKMALDATKRKKLIYFTGDYHGLTRAALSVNGVAKQQRRFDVDGIHDELPFNDADSLERAFAQSGKDIAGVIIEPVQARFGLVADEQFLNRARALCTRHGALLIFDEIKSGFGRTGRNFFYQWSGSVPDIMLIAKGLSGGVSAIGALLYSDDVYSRVFNDVEKLALYSSTFRENNIAMAVGLAVLHLMEHENPLENVLNAESRIRERLDGAELPNGDRLSVKGKGLQLSIALSGHRKKTIQALVDAIEGDMFYTMCCAHLLKDQNIVAMIPNRFGSAVAAIPALNIPPDLIDQFCNGILSVFSELTSKSSLAYAKDVASKARQLL